MSAQVIVKMARKEWITFFVVGAENIAGDGYLVLEFEHPVNRKGSFEDEPHIQNSSRPVQNTSRPITSKKLAHRSGHSSVNSKHNQVKNRES